MNRLSLWLERVKEDFYWHFIFPQTEYAKRHFNRYRSTYGTTYIRKEVDKPGMDKVDQDFVKDPLTDNKKEAQP